MSQGSRLPYEFDCSLPLQDVDPGTNLLVTGPSVDGAREVATELLLGGPARHEGLLVVSADVAGQRLLDRFDASSQMFDRSLVGIVDCSGLESDDNQRFEPHAEPISNPGDLTRIEIEFSLLYDKLDQRDLRGIRIGLFSVSTLAAHAPLQDVSRFVHMLTGRIVATDDLGVLLVDPTAVDEPVVDTIEHFCDGRVEVRDGDGGYELRCEGMDGQPETWTEVELD